jgi:hypothetical protein
MTVKTDLTAMAGPLAISAFLQLRTCSFIIFFYSAVLLCSPPAAAQRIAALAPQVRKYASVSTSKVVLEHVEIIDGTGAPSVADQNITLEAGKIIAISSGADEAASDGTTILNLRGYSVMPGIVGMHDHLFYYGRPNLAPDSSFDGPALFLQMSFSAPRLYLANGVTTARTIGSANPYNDLRLKQAIEAGDIPGPHLDAPVRFWKELAAILTFRFRSLKVPMTRARP